MDKKMQDAAKQKKTKSSSKPAAGMQTKSHESSTASQSKPSMMKGMK
ncbi:hypothetical protein [Granulicella sp. dw_53]|nr:hypothetical protein [Granulicella sp. dw_53]